MSMFILTTSCLTTSSLPWFMDLTFQVSMQYCSLHDQILLSSPDISTTEHHFCFGPAASFFLGLLVVILCSSPVAYWTPSNLGDSSFGVISFSLFIQFMRSSRQVYWGDPSSSGSDFVNSPLWPISLGWPYIAWLTASLNYASPFTMTRQWSMKGILHWKMSPPGLSEGVQYATGEEQRRTTSSPRKNEVAGPKWKQCSVVDMSGDESKI